VSSETRPVQLLRELPLKVSQRTQLGRWTLYLAMMMVFGVLVGMVVGTPLEGIAYVLVGGVAIMVLRVVFWVVLWVMLKLPLPPFPMLRLARANLRQRKMQASLAVMALFAGAFSVSFAALVIYNAQSMVRQQRGSDEGFNLMVYTTMANAADAVNQMNAQGAQDTYVAERVRGLVDTVGMAIEGRDATDLNKDMQYDGEWAEDENVALLPEYFTESYTVGDTLTLDINGQERELTLVGFYMVDWDSIGALQGAAMIVPRRLIHEFADVQIQTMVFGAFPVNTLNDVTTTLGQSLAGMLVFSRADINDTMIATFQALFTFAASVAGLAFVAGAVLIANSAGLTVVERYREIGVFKAVGFTSGHVLRSLLSEYGFLGVVAGLFGIVGAATAIIVMNIALSISLTIEPLILTSMLLFSVSIAVVSAAVVAWQPTRVRPLDVLRYE
jgi:putative ABC transport system permease protein